MKIDTSLPTKGFCAHRCAFERAPENTLVAVREAVAQKVPMLEVDLRLTRDGELVLMHDAVIDRTTDGQGQVSDFTLEALRRFDAGAWKGASFAGTRIPTFAEALALMPRDVWINCHVKEGEATGAAAARTLLEAGRGHQAFLAAGTEAIRGAREIFPEVLICNMERRESSENYVKETIAMGAAFIQFTSAFPPSAELTRRLHEHGILANYFYARTPGELPALCEAGVDFVLVNDVPTFQQAEGAAGNGG